MTKAETIDQGRAQPAVLTTEADTPVLRLFRKHRALVEAAGTYPDDRDEELHRLFYKEANRIEREMQALPSTCAADFAAKVIVDTCEGGALSDWKTGELWKEARQLTHADAASQQGTMTAEEQTPEERLRLIADALGLAAPQTLLSDDGAPSEAVLAFCREAGASLDYIFCGDMTPLFRRAHRLAQQEGATPPSGAQTPLVSLYFEWKAFKDQMNHGPDVSEEVWDAQMRELERITDRALDMEPTSVLDMAAKIAIADDDGDMRRLSVEMDALSVQALRMLGVTEGPHDGSMAAVRAEWGVSHN